MQDLTKTKYGKIDLNKLKKPVLNVAIEKANKERQRLKRQLTKLEKKLLPDDDESAEQFKRAKEYDKAYCTMEEYDYDPIFTLPCLEISPSRGNQLLAELSKVYLKVNPKYGIKIIVEAYNDYYQIGQKCAYCGKTIPPSSKKGRTKKYCSDACRQKAYRERQKNEDGTNNDNSPVTSNY